MTSRNAQILDQFRVEALNRGIPADEVERWMELVRPRAFLTEGGDGPVVGRFGGPLLLPTDVKTPWCPLLATVDCAALPAEATGLPLPPDGRLLFFGSPDPDGDCCSMGDVVYIPADAAVQERERYPENYPYDSYAEIYDDLPQGELHLIPDVSLPSHGEMEIPEPPGARPLWPEYPRSEELSEVWNDQLGWTPLAIGGYGSTCDAGDPVVAARRFERTYVHSDFNP